MLANRGEPLAETMKRNERGYIARTGELLYRVIVALCFALFLAASALSLFALFAMSDPACTEKFLWLPCSQKSLLVGTLAAAVLLLVFLLVQINGEATPLWVLLGVALSMRIVATWAIAGSLVPFSDYNDVWGIANGTASEQTLLYKSFFPEWSNWAALVKMLVESFAIEYDFLVWCECVIGCLIALEVVWLGYAMFKRLPLALMAGCLYAFLPSQILFSMICKPDSLSLLFILAGMALCVRLFGLRSHVDFKVGVISLVAGLLMAIGTLFKPLAIIAVIAFGISWIMAPCREEERWKRVAAKAIPIAIIGSLVVSLPIIVRPLTSQVLDTEISSSATMSYLCIGLNTEGEGQIHIGDKSRFYNQLRLSGVEEKEAASLTLAMLQEDWHENWNNLPGLLAQKVRWAWQDDMMPARFLKNALGDNASSMNAMLSFGATFSQSSYFLLMISAAIGAFALLKRRNYGSLFALLYILGFALLLLLSESQSRYKSNVLPLISIVSAMGLYSFVSLIRKQIQHLKTRMTDRLPLHNAFTKNENLELARDVYHPITFVEKAKQLRAHHRYSSYARYHDAIIPLKLNDAIRAKPVIAARFLRLLRYYDELRRWEAVE